MPYVPSHAELGEHPKLLRLCRLLEVSRPTAIGHLQLLWWWTLRFAPDGDLSRFANAEVAAACDWTGDADHFMQGLHAAGFLDAQNGKASVHDWSEYGGAYVRVREAARIRQRRRRESLKRESASEHGIEELPLRPRLRPEAEEDE